MPRLPHPGAAVVFHARNVCKTCQTGAVQVCALHDLEAAPIKS
ncbi:MAG TPA: hypothetical protein VIP31_04975 [Acidovorax sp.]|jgi:putative ABC transport system ATP-binding protein